MKTHSIETFERRAEYTKKQTLRLKIGSWNVASLNGSQDDLSSWFASPRGSKSSHEDVELYVLGLQEVVDISSATQTLRPFVDPTVATRWKESTLNAVPGGFQLVAEQQLVGLLVLIYASPALSPKISNVSTVSVGTGLLGYMGNKGAVAVRLLLGDVTRIAFVNAHMSAGDDASSLQRRNWDASQITSRAKFSAITDMMSEISGTAEALDDQDMVFWFGDLNYRIQGMSGEDVRRLLQLHSEPEEAKFIQKRDARSETLDGTSESTVDLVDPHKFDNLSDDEHIQSPDTDVDKFSSDGFTKSETSTLDGDIPDPASLQTTISSLLPHDELHAQQQAEKAFHDGWAEGPITFLPTYKYDIGNKSSFDSSEKKRCPSWCDRILYRSRASKQKADAKLHEKRKASLKDESLQANGVAAAVEDEESFFEYDPQTDGASNGKPADDVTLDADNDAASDDDIVLEWYSSFQHVTSSDHKPLGAVFSLKYNAFDPDLKAQVAQEVSREIDRLENEERPTVTFVIERSTNSDNHSAVEDADSTSQIDFGDIRFAESKTRNMTIANTGQVPASISFSGESATELLTQSELPAWLSVNIDMQESSDESVLKDDRSCILHPGDTCTVQMVLAVHDMDLVKKFNDGAEVMERIIFLRVEDGRDNFIVVKGRWLWTCFGQTMERLCRIPEGGIRQLQLQYEQKSRNADENVNVTAKCDTTIASNPDKQDEDVKWSSPRELFKLTSSIEDLVIRTIADWDMRKHEAGHDLPPWQAIAGWPFCEDSWITTTGAAAEDAAVPSSTLPKDSDLDGVKDKLRLKIYEALDTDKELTKITIDPKPPPDTHAPPKASTRTTTSLTLMTETLAETLLLFLHSLVEGIITPQAWEQIEPIIPLKVNSSASTSTYTSTFSPTSTTSIPTPRIFQSQSQREKEKQKEKEKDKTPTTAIDQNHEEEQQEKAEHENKRSAILEALSDSATTSCRSVSFVIVTAMISRVVAELNPTRDTADENSSDSVAPGSNRGVSAGGTAPVVMKDDLSQRKIAALMADVLVRVPEAPRMREREKRALGEKKVGLVELFL